MQWVRPVSPILPVELAYFAYQEDRAGGTDEIVWACFFNQRFPGISGGFYYASALPANCMP